ncbi:precorrin-2 dehydrogenase/sirohydrochlorin ferrochelatase family protein [Methanosarcina mazei]|jgi:precorrin-2 dehydrogenase/sirohydrochlorin ferrochelatase|uniref:precorrin-2 dehydrogenase n=8 Tax=Methanosarcina mazei TaxID=2209 RepID=A0A0F8PZC3_METMZ|nr:bifunctional precorrin-2 dehydrogenase/sirohydrochlorin ferrochelatase [Methanosarcina mazei]AAM31436.1 Siroheme synthase [Methanosarcina mazei Go1]AGF97163.1 Siroheme synthase / Precorrin-2 oxidase/Sirohydrochlorin ferrochelatase [Methanosarcina mazei Tuc01]AKB41855.1 Siroheme synthase [Methanosarcina mazei WWM610]AKB62784.1 Siroheme synthase [Methanosarcina mazei SarPi]AKB66135.1 Siroheme synthase [Methanosarcina mazei S-6]
MAETNNFLPLMLDLSGRKIVIFGGGSVGERKAELFCGCADTVVVSLDFSERLQELEASGQVRLSKLDLTAATDSKLREIVSGAFLVIPATSSSELNRKISNIAGESDILINQVDALGSVVIPSVIKRGDLVIGISTLGHSPAVSKYTRKQIENVITPAYSDMIRLQDELRSFLKLHIKEQKKRKVLLWKVLENEKVWNGFSESYEKAAEEAYKIISDNVGNFE